MLDTRLIREQNREEHPASDFDEGGNTTWPLIVESLCDEVDRLREQVARLTGVVASLTERQVENSRPWLI